MSTTRRACAPLPYCLRHDGRRQHRPRLALTVEDSEWQRRGATLSDKTAREEYGLEQDDIIRAIVAGRLHYREGSVYGNPFLRLVENA
jgi:hypothetical protein